MTILLQRVAEFVLHRDTQLVDHLDKETIFELLQAEEIGISLTENLAMYPAAIGLLLYSSK